MNKIEHSGQRLSRREAIRWVVAAAAVTPFLSDIELAGAVAAPSGGRGYGLDPDMLKGEVPWERTMTAAQLKLTGALADIILPRVNERSPSASEVKVPDFIDEWISAPYPEQRRSREIVLEGLVWMDAEAERRYGRNFVELTWAESTAVCDDICFFPKVDSKYTQGARFFSHFRNLCLGGYYTTDVGMRDAGYVGNLPMISFPGPPPEVLKRLGIDNPPW